MKKNGQYVGVDEKYVPEEEKYVDNNLNSEIKNDMHNIYQGAKGYVSNKDNQEKMKNVGKKGLKIAKGFGIGYLIFVGIVIVMGISIFILVFSQFFRVNKQGDEIIDKATNIINQGVNQGINNIDDGYNKMNVDDFNFDIETYSGTHYGSTVSRLLDNVITKIKKNNNHPITVIYGTTTTSKADEITILKKQFDRSKQYEVSLDYDSNGYINKITVTNY